MSRSICYHTDEHIGGAVVSGLRRRNIEVSTSLEAGLVSVTDERQLTYAHEHACFLVTQDADFLRLHTQGVLHSGIAFFRQGTPVGTILSMLVLLHDLLIADEMTGRVEFL